MAKYTIKAIDTETYGVILEHTAEDRESAEQIQKNMGNGDGYMTVIIASVGEAKRNAIANLYAKAGV